MHIYARCHTNTSMRTKYYKAVLNEAYNLWPNTGLKTTMFIIVLTTHLLIRMKIHLKCIKLYLKNRNNESNGNDSML